MVRRDLGARAVTPHRLGRRRWIHGALAAGATLGVACERHDVPPGRLSASLWFSYGGRNREVLEALVRRFNASQSDVWIHAVYQGDYYEGLAKLRTSIAAGAAPALSHVVGEVVPYLFEAGTLEPLDAYPGADALDVVPALGQTGSWVGGGERPLVALPFNRSTPIAYLNGAIFDAEGLEAPKTWDALATTAQRLTTRAGERITRYGFACPISWWFWAAMVGQAGGSVVEPDGTVSLGGTAGERALAFWQRLIHDDRSMKLPPGRDFNAWEATNQDFLAGRAAMIWTSTAFLEYIEDNAAFPVIAAPLPVDRRAAVPTGGTHFVVLREAPAEEKAAAWTFLRWMLEAEQAIEWSTRTGYMPITRGAIARLAEQGYFVKNPNAKVTLDQLAFAFPWPWSRDLFRISREIVQPRLESAALRRSNPAAVLAEARAQAARIRGRRPG
jgi:sn-glycerol 3-phosphate transport system substrate-binding protein